MELEVHQIRWHVQLHWIPWNLECANFDDRNSSMEFHGKWSAPISMTRAVLWNSMELGVRQFRWHEQFHGIPWNNPVGVRQYYRHEQFHGIPWNFKCANFADKSSFTEFNGTRSVLISLTRPVPWNSMELQMRQVRSHEQFHGISWILECANTLTRAVPWNFMEFHGTWSAPISLTRAVPWNSMEFNWTCREPISLTRAVPWNSMELGVCRFRWHEQFHGIPWNLGLHKLCWHEKFHGIPSWNSMELGVRQFQWHKQFHGITWNLKCANVPDTSSSM